MKYLVLTSFALMGTMILVSSCNKGDDTACTESTWYQNADSDGLGNPNVSQTACDQSTSYVADNTCG